MSCCSHFTFQHLLFDYSTSCVITAVITYLRRSSTSGPSQDGWMPNTQSKGQVFIYDRTSAPPTTTNAVYFWILAAHQSFQHFSARLCTPPPSLFSLCARPSPRPHCHVNDLFAPQPAIHQSISTRFISPNAFPPVIRSGGCGDGFW